MADDKGDAATVGGVGKVELDPSSGLEDELAPSRLAFCSSTLEKKLGLVIKKGHKWQYEGFNGNTRIHSQLCFHEYCQQHKNKVVPHFN